MIYDGLKVHSSVVREMNKSLQKHIHAINSVMELHKPSCDMTVCDRCDDNYPCLTVQTIYEALNG